MPKILKPAQEYKVTCNKCEFLIGYYKYELKFSHIDNEIKVFKIHCANCKEFIYIEKPEPHTVDAQFIIECGHCKKYFTYDEKSNDCTYKYSKY